MLLRVLGSSGTAPTADNPASGYLIEVAGAKLWFDAGPGTFMALARLMDPAEVSAVAITHMHPDHCTDLFALFHHHAYVAKTSRRTPLVLPPNGIERITAFLGAGPDHAFFDVFDPMVPHDGEPVEFGPVELLAAAARHSVPAWGFRVDHGAVSLGYTGDTGPSDHLETHFRGVDLLLAEASLEEADHYPFHMTPAQAGEMAAAAQARRLVLTHRRPASDDAASCAAASATAGVDVSLASPGDEFMITSAFAEQKEESRDE